MTIVFVSVTYYDIISAIQLLFIVLRAGLVMLLMLMMMTVSMMELRNIATRTTDPGVDCFNQ